jgi:hypothetical protein
VKASVKASVFYFQRPSPQGAKKQASHVSQTRIPRGADCVDLHRTGKPADELKSASIADFEPQTL